MRIISAERVRASVGMREAIEAMREAFGQLSAGVARVPVRLRLDAAAGVTLFMPAYLGRSGDLGAKIVSFYGGNPKRGLPAISAVVMLFDSQTGVPTALMEGGYLTALRTGAASGLATDLLARRDAAVLTIFGAGAQAPTQIEAVRAVRPIREVRIVSRTRQSAERLAKEIKGVEVKVFDDRSAAVAGADVIVTATTSLWPVFDGHDVEPGTHINGVGSYTPEMQEVDGTVIQRAKIVVDSREAALKEAGDLIIPLHQGLIGAEDVGTELGEIVNGTKPGRTSETEITFFKSVGVAVQDVAVARRVLSSATLDPASVVSL
ncbi:MAG: ornithine cyclodeaminase [Gemmatimonadetes bacterium]|nr:ornithine cyclodeaminase [Gemmatimonadota bacterium]